MQERPELEMILLGIGSYDNLGIIMSVVCMW